jgi:hypothetical protein
MFLLIRGKGLQLSAQLFVKSTFLMPNKGEQMRSRKVLIALWIFAAMFFLSTAGIAYAQPDMTPWLGKWFSYNMTTKGVAFTGSSFLKGSQKENGYLEVRAWDPYQETFQVAVYFLDDVGWHATTETFYYYEGTGLNFVFAVHSTTDSNSTTEILGIVTGKEKDGVLQSATIKSLGGYLVEADEGGFRAGSLTLKGKMVDESKIKVPPEVIIPELPPVVVQP